MGNEEEGDEKKIQNRIMTNLSGLIGSEYRGIQFDEDPQAFEDSEEEESENKEIEKKIDEIKEDEKNKVSSIFSF